MYLEKFSEKEIERAGRFGRFGRAGAGGTGGRAGTGGTGGSVETYFLKLYLIDCEIVERLHIK